MLKVLSCLFTTGKQREGDGGGVQPQGRIESAPVEDLNEISGGRRHLSRLCSLPHRQPQPRLPREKEREREGADLARHLLQTSGQTQGVTRWQKEFGMSTSLPSVLSMVS